MSLGARRIYQGWLDATSDAILNGDMDAVRAHFSLPYYHKSVDGKMLVETREDLELGQTTYGNTLRAHGATHLIRICDTADHLSEDYVQGTHVTHAFRNTSPVIPSFGSRMVLRNTDAGWKMIEIESAIRSRTWPVNHLHVDEGFLDTLELAENDARAGPLSAMETYQHFLDEMTRAMVENDLALFQSMFDERFRAHSDIEDEWDKKPESAHIFFRLHNERMREVEADTFERRASNAEFVAANLICGYHTAHLLKNGEDVHTPVKSRMILRHTRGSWKLRAVTNSVTTLPTQKDSVVTSELVTQRQIIERNKKWQNSN